ncbi:hypothetical protein NECAME_09507 [Necator americanus]|uniref:Uncharacterized protein n=1 Tax=Necator americanus TaxID=51031 RepID=W2TFG5_NECAM|nr:hypothetical protein NECAME_09507 [Necator americanus]ETN79936.1 hypothetical protein NECAME_09507 [Necator americanus]
MYSLHLYHDEVLSMKQELYETSSMDAPYGSYECMGGLAFLLNASVVQYSNWPIADGYITSLNVPANPSAIPKTGSFV